MADEGFFRALDEAVNAVIRDLTPEQRQAVAEILRALEPLSPQAQRDLMLYIKAKCIQDIRRQIKLQPPGE